MACVFLARLNDYGCDFSPRNVESASRGSSSLSYRKIDFRFRRQLLNTEPISVNLRKWAACVKSKSRVPVNAATQQERTGQNRIGIGACVD
jgi:hypothetical protein